MSENKSVPSGGSAYSATCQAITLWSRDLRPETKSVRIAHVVGQNYENIWGARASAGLGSNVGREHQRISGSRRCRERQPWSIPSTDRLNTHSVY